MTDLLRPGGLSEGDFEVKREYRMTSVLRRLRKNISVSETSQSKGPEVDERVVCSGKSKGKSVRSVRFRPWVSKLLGLPSCCALAANSGLQD